MNKNDIARYSRHCARFGCLQIGKWLPVMVINLVNQNAAELPVTCGLPMFLCDNHKKDFNPLDAMTFKGRIKLSLFVVQKRGKRLNWDTVRVEWRSESDMHKVLSVDESSLH